MLSPISNRNLCQSKGRPIPSINTGGGAAELLELVFVSSLGLSTDYRNQPSSAVQNLGACSHTEVEGIPGQRKLVLPLSERGRAGLCIVDQVGLPRNWSLS